MSLVEDQRNRENAVASAERGNAWLEHMSALSRERIAAEAYYDPRVIAFKARRKTQAGQLRWWKPRDILPKKRTVFAKEKFSLESPAEIKH